ncbi:MAG: hypothetical protein ABSD71_12765 [Bacteroidales bacterium]|jgi:hypothetical protein
MKTIFAIIVLAIIEFYSCKKENVDYQSKGTIIGADKGACMCCGGWFISIDKKVYEFWTLPDSTINLNQETFPLKVMLNWKSIPSCRDNLISIQSIKLE